MIEGHPKQWRFNGNAEVLGGTWPAERVSKGWISLGISQPSGPCCTSNTLAVQPGAAAWRANPNMEGQTFPVRLS